MKKILIAMLAGLLLTASVSAGCGSTDSASPEAAAASSAAETESGEVSAEEGAQHLENLDGTYVSLFDVILKDRYRQIWIDEAAAIVGKDQAEETVAMLQASVSGTLTGRDAVEAYSENPENMAFDCSFKQGVTEFVIEDGTITGRDKDGKELFSHSYTFTGYDAENGWYEYETADEDAGEFRYFLFGSDEPGETCHIEFRYGSDIVQLEKWMEGDYAYWMASGLPKGSGKMAKGSIRLLVTENLRARTDAVK